MDTEKDIPRIRTSKKVGLVGTAVVAGTALLAAFSGGTSKSAYTPQSGVGRDANLPDGGGIPRVVETATGMPSATAVKEVPTVAPTEVPVEVPTDIPEVVPTEAPIVAPTATIEALPTQEQAKPGEIGNFEINGKKVTITKFTEIPDANDAARKTVTITCLASADFTSDISSGEWTLNLATDSGQFPAKLMPVIIDMGPAEVDGKSIPEPRLGKLISASIPADIDTYSLLITHDLGTVQDANGGVAATSSYSIPLRQASSPADGK